MADTIGITRQHTSSEQKDYTVVGKKTPKELFLKELSEKTQEYTRKHLPFDERCARQDYEDKVDNIMRESERRNGFVSEQELRNVSLGDLDVYGDESRFIVGDVDEDIEMQNINGIRTARTIGYTQKFTCKNRGHGISVFVPIDVWEKRNKVKKKEE